MTLATTAVEVVDALYELLDFRKDELELADVWLGEQQLLPRTPAVCVIFGQTESELAGSNRRVQDTYNVTFQVYHCKLTDNQDVERECQLRAEALRAFLNNYDSGRLDGLVVHSMVTSNEPGYANRAQGTQASWYKTSRLSWSGMTRYNLTFAP